MENYLLFIEIDSALKLFLEPVFSPIGLNRIQGIRNGKLTEKQPKLSQESWEYKLKRNIKKKTGWKDGWRHSFLNDDYLQAESNRIEHGINNLFSIPGITSTYWPGPLGKQVRNNTGNNKSLFI